LQTFKSRFVSFLNTVSLSPESLPLQQTNRIKEVQGHVRKSYKTLTAHYPGNITGAAVRWWVCRKKVQCVVLCCVLLCCVVLCCVVTWSKLS